MLFNIHIVKLLFLYIQNICYNIVSKVSACLILVECFMNTRVNSMIEFLPVDVTSTCCSIIGISLNKVKRVRGFFFRKICYLQITLSWADLIGSSTWVNVMTGEGRRMIFLWLLCRDYDNSCLCSVLKVLILTVFHTSLWL